jgi:hypothetical protein
VDPIRADRLGVKASEVEIVCFGDRFSGKWVARVMDGEREWVLTESRDLFEMCHWKAQLVRLQT